MNKSFKIMVCLGLILPSLILSGCAVGFYKGRPSDVKKIEELKDELSRLKEAKSLLEAKLKDEIGANQVKLSMSERGLVITFVAEVLFDSGKSNIRQEGKNILDKIASVLQQEGMENKIGIEGHTDNVPIKYSGYKSNWELSTARATSVLHYLIDSCGMQPDKLSATGYGEYQPVASNDTKEGRQSNRRVEIVIKPEELTKPIKAKALSGQTENEGYIK